MSARRAWTWNVLLVAVEAALLAWAHALGVAWSTLAVELAGLPTLGAAAVVHVVRVRVPRALRRYERQLAAATGRQPAPLARVAPAGSRTVVTSETA